MPMNTAVCPLISVDGKFSCVVRHEAGEDSDRLDDAGLTPRAADVRDDVEAAFGLPILATIPKDKKLS